MRGPAKVIALMVEVSSTPMANPISIRDRGRERQCRAASKPTSTSPLKLRQRRDAQESVVEAHVQCSDSAVAGGRIRGAWRCGLFHLAGDVRGRVPARVGIRDVHQRDRERRTETPSSSRRSGREAGGGQRRGHLQARARANQHQHGLPLSGCRGAIWTRPPTRTLREWTSAQRQRTPAATRTGAAGRCGALIAERQAASAVGAANPTVAEAQPLRKPTAG